VKKNVCSIWPFAQISDDFYFLIQYLAMCQIFCCCIIQGVSCNYHNRNVKSRVSNFQASVSAFMTKSRLEIWARSRSRRLRSRLHHCPTSLYAELQLCWLGFLLYHRVLWLCFRGGYFPIC